MTLLTGTIGTLFEAKKETKTAIVENKRNEPLKESETLKNLFREYDITLKGAKANLEGYILANDYYLVYVSPTSNCQTCSVSGFQQIFSVPNKINSLLYDIYDKTKKRLIIIDIRQDYMCYFNEMINKDMVISKTLYNSTNGSNMALIMLSIVNLVEEMKPR